MYNCPHCDKPGISVLRRFSLGPAVPTTCHQCGKKVGVSYRKSFWAFVPFGLSLVAAYLVRPIGFSIAIAAVGAIIMFALWVPLVPLEKRE
jgi:hypothetical protein